jgi:tetratricopeptide (TPR) repeat protein
LAAYDQAVALAPGNAQFLFNRAAVRRFLGALVQAEADYDRVIALKPADYEAYKNRSDLRTQTPERNHIAELESLVARQPRLARSSAAALCPRQGIRGSGRLPTVF